MREKLRDRSYGDLPTKWLSPSTATGVECCSLKGKKGRKKGERRREEKEEGRRMRGSGREVRRGNEEKDMRG